MSEAKFSKLPRKKEFAPALMRPPALNSFG